MPIQTAIDSISNSQGSPFGFKNRIINGAIVIDQRQAGSNVAASACSNGGYHTADRWASSLTQSSKLTFQQVADAPTGFKYSMKLTSVSAFTPAASDYFGVMQLIEGYNVADLDYGLSTAKSTSISFWAKSSITGTFSGSIFSPANKGNPFSYTISAANTWTYVTINNIIGDTATALNSTTTGTGLYVYFSFGSGSSQLGSAGTWQSGTILGVTGQTNHIATNGATLQITGVQFEVGKQATAFDYRDYGNELRMCQRYLPAYNFSAGNTPSAGGIAYSTTAAVMNLIHPVQTRIAPTGITVTGTFNSYNNGGGNAGNFSSITLGQFQGTYSSIINCTGGSGLVQGNATLLLSPSGTSQILLTGCEL
jgi:hypothetical protein